MAMFKSKKNKEFTDRTNFVTLADRKKFLSSFDEPGREPYSPEIEDHIESYKTQISYLESCKKSISNIFSLVENEKNSADGKEKTTKKGNKFPNEYKSFFLSKALIVATPFLIGIGLYILSVKAGGISQIFSAATWGSFFKSLLIGGIFGTVIGASDYAANRLLNTEKRINKRAEKQNKKRIEKGKLSKKSILLKLHDKVEERRLSLKRMTYDVEKEIDNVISGNPSFFVKDGKLKSCFNFLSWRKKRNLLNALKEINARNNKLDSLSILEEEIIKEKALKVDAKRKEATILTKPAIDNKELKDPVKDFIANFTAPLTRKDQEEEIYNLKKNFKESKGKK